MKPKETQKHKSPKTKLNIDVDAVRRLSEILKETDLSEIEYEAEGCRIRVGRHQTGGGHYLPSFSPAQPMPQSDSKEISPAPPSPGTHPGTIKSPMVGTAYLCPKPGDPPFIEVGKKIILRNII